MKLEFHTMAEPMPKEKKISWKDGFRALWCIAKYNLK